MMNRILTTGIFVHLTEHDYSQQELKAIVKFLDELKISVLQRDWALDEKCRRDMFDDLADNYQEED
jgi:hypothetical protein